jgi:phage shock protein E
MLRSALLLACSLALFACAETPSAPVAPVPSGAAPSVAAAPAARGLPDRDPALAHELVAKGALLLDVRTKEEYDSKHLDGAANISIQELPARLADVETLVGGDKTKPIVVYCGSGRRSATAKEKLLAAGYTQVTNLGGIADWDKK